MNLKFNNSRIQIAVFIGLVASSMVALASILTLSAVIQLEDNDARSTLTQSMESISQDVTANLGKDSQVSYFSRSNEVSDFIADALPNISSQKNLVSESSAELENGVTISADLSDDELGNIQNDKSVYSRVILGDGSILFTSDLFETFYIAPEELGFNKTDSSICIYSHSAELTSGEYEGAIIQLAKYCVLDAEMQNSIILSVALIAIAIGILSFGIGYIIAKLLLKPLHDSAKITTHFARNVYHEMLTPISVATSTAQAHLLTKQYKKGLSEVSDELDESHEILEKLKNSLLYKSEDIRVVNIAKLMTEDLITPLAKKFNLEINNNQHSPNQELQIDEIQKKVPQYIVELILRNVRSNVQRYADPDRVVEITINTKSLIIQNQSLTEQTEVKGNGMGLDITKGLCKEIGWKCKFKKSKDSFTTTVRW